MVAMQLLTRLSRQTRPSSHLPLQTVLKTLVTTALAMNFVFLYAPIAHAADTYLGTSRELGLEVVDDFMTPVRTDAKYILLSGAVATGALLWFESSTNQATQQDWSTSKPLGKTSHYGDLAGQLIPNAAYVAGMWADQYFTGSTRSAERARLMIESTALAAFSSTVLKYVVNEPRPDHSDRHSFPSGHATTAFAFAAAVALEHPWYYWVPAYGLATFVGISRVNDNKHYLHDVAAGATLGATYAFGTWLNMQRRHEAVSNTESSSSQGAAESATWFRSASLLLLPGEDFKSIQVMVPMRF
jgi:hypothetical protein